jgi:hypothetical protein
MQVIQDYFEGAINLNESENFRVRIQAELQDDPVRQYEFDYDYQ